MGQGNETLTQEDRLKAIAYQFITLYERWSEDRQVAAKQGADTAELVKKFTEQVNAFKELEPAVREQLARSIVFASEHAAKSVGEKIEAAANQAIEKTVGRLSKSAMQAERQLERYQAELKQGHWRTIFIACATTLVASFLIARWVLPSSIWQLTDQQIQYLSFGQEVSMVWPHLSKKEKDHLMDVAEKLNKKSENR